MWKILTLCLALVTPVFAHAAETLNHSGINFSEKISDDTVKLFYEMAVDEYNYSNYGFSRDLFTAIVQHGKQQPGAYLYLGKIYEEVAIFKNVELSKQCYLNAATSKSLLSTMRQEAYLALIRLTDDSDMAIKYAKASSRIATSDESKQALILAYHKQFSKTGDEAFLTKAEDVARDMNSRYFEVPNQFTSEQNTQQVNLQR